MKKRVAFSIADNNNLKYYEMMKNSLRKFHTEEELPLILFGQNEIALTNDRDIFYRATPIFLNSLIDEYETVIKLDADQIITGNLSHIWEDDFDVAVVHNSNPLEKTNMEVRVWDIPPEAYVNNGMVVVKSRDFVRHWYKLAYSPHFFSYQMREQDLLNILVYYGNYRVKFLDLSNKWHGLVWKGYESMVKLENGKLILPQNAKNQPIPWPPDGDKELCAWHVAGGQTPNKLNYRIKFTKEVSDWIDKLVKL